MDETITADFYKEEFDIDDFLNKQTEGHELKEILHFLNDMKNKNSIKMTTVLQEKTDSVVLIAEQLQSLYKKIDNLQGPLSQLKEEIQVLAKRVGDVVELFDSNSKYTKDVQTTRSNLAAVRAYKVTLLNTSQCLKNCTNEEDLDFEHLERVICKYAFHVYTLKELHIKDSDTLRPSVDNLVKSILKETFLKACKAGRTDRVTRTIDLFVFLDLLDALKEIICNDIVKPKLEPIFCEENLHACGNDMDLVYGQALALIQHDLTLLISIIKKESIKLDVILDCYWNVADKLLRTNLISITAAGHPDAFFKHFNNTHKFLKDIGKSYGNVDLYRENASFIEHLKRFNLLVYYEIRHQYMSSAFEMVILKCSEIEDVAKMLTQLCRPDYKKHELKLKTSSALDVLFEYIFCDKVFIPMISEQFMKSALLLAARYSTWIRNCLMISLRQFPRSSELVLISACLMNDLQKLRVTLTRDFHKLDDAIDSKMRELLHEQFNKDLTNIYGEVSDFLIKYHMEKLKEDLKNVSDIPRLYRKTNRSLPQSCSSYLIDAFTEVDLLSNLNIQQASSNKVIHFGDSHRDVLRNLLVAAAKEYNDMVYAVLNAVFKTEESLKRLKSRNIAASDSNASQGASDEAKIRLQIKLDVQQFAKKVRTYNVDNLEGELQNLLTQIEGS